MDIKHEAVRFLNAMRSTYIQKDVNVRLSLLKGSNDPSPRKTALGFSVRVNLLETLALYAGLALSVMTIHECYKRACEERAKKKLIAKYRHDTENE